MVFLDIRYVVGVGRGERGEVEFSSYSVKSLKAGAVCEPPYVCLPPSVPVWRACLVSPCRVNEFVEL